MAELDLAFENGSIHVFDEGRHDGIPIIMVHGMPGDAHDFVHVNDALAKSSIGDQLRRIRFDLPGLGHSDAGKWLDGDLRDLAQVVPWIARELKLENYFVLGHSFGGAVAMTAVALVPKNVAALILINSAPTVRHRGMRLSAWGFSLVKKAYLIPAIANWASAYTRSIYRHLGFKKYSDATVTFMRLHMRVMSKLRFHIVRWAARNLQRPVLVISNADDPLVEESATAHLLQTLNGKMERHHLRLSAGGHKLGRAKSISMIEPIVMMINEFREKKEQNPHLS